MGLDPGLALLHPGNRSHAAGELGKYLPEHALAAVAVDDALVVDKPRRGFRERALRNACRDRLLLEVCQETIKTHAGMTGCATWGRGWPGGSGNRSRPSCRLSRCRLRSAEQRQQNGAKKNVKRKSCR